MLDKAGPVSCQPWAVVPRPDSWVDESESIVLIGEAAHPQGVCAYNNFTLTPLPIPLSPLFFSSCNLPNCTPSLVPTMAAVSRLKMLPSSARSSRAFEAWSKSPRFYMRIRTCARGARTQWQPWSTKMCGWRFRARRGSATARSAGPRSPPTRLIHRPEADRPTLNSRRSRRCGVTMRLTLRTSGGWSGACCASGQ